jgi:hypothetical protein
MHAEHPKTTIPAAWLRWRAPVTTAWMALSCAAVYGGVGGEATALANDTCAAAPGAGDYCASYQCGPCGEGEGDCDPGQCAAGLECVEEGAIDHCRVVDTCAAAPGAGDYCASYQCGPCLEGEGDCDPGQCGPGLECVEEGAIDHCRAVDTCAAAPGASDYCASYQCGPCGNGEGDCDPGQCGPGLECVEEGAVDHCRPDTCAAAPGASDYCTSAQCGTCAVGEGDCDPGQCDLGLECVEEGSVDHCRQASPSNFEVKVSGVWKSVCCNGGTPGLSDQACSWTESDRILTDETAHLKLNCPEGNPAACVCDYNGERMHGSNGYEIDYSIHRNDGGPVYPNYQMETCVVVDASGHLKTAWSSASCPSFRLR